MLLIFVIFHALLMIFCYINVQYILQTFLLFNTKVTFTSFPMCSSIFVYLRRFLFIIILIIKCFRVHIAKMHTKENLARECPHCAKITMGLESHIKIFHFEHYKDFMESKVEDTFDS